MFVRRVTNCSFFIKFADKCFLNLENCSKFLASSPILHSTRATYCQTREADNIEVESSGPLEFLPDVRRLKLVTFNDKAVEEALRHDEQKIKDDLKSMSVESVLHRPFITADDPVVEKLFKGIKNGERSALAQGITLIESVHPMKRAQGQFLVGEILEYTRKKQKHTLNTLSSFRIGLSGPPGAGKSTHIEALGKMLTERNHKVAVLAVDPSSSTSGGSLLGDKTRMLKLALDPNAYIRPSPNSGNLGGVTRVTNDAIVLCEGAGYDIIIVETVGVGQSEFAVADMVDLFELLLPPAGGDELQGIKKGIVEVADMVVINKSDGDLVPAARRIQMEYVSAMKFIRPKNKVWRPCVLRVSSVNKEGMEEMWTKMEEYRTLMSQSGELERLRRKQHVCWMHNHIRDGLISTFNQLPTIKMLTPELEMLVRKNAITPGQAADKILRHFIKLVEGKNLKISPNKQLPSPFLDTGKATQIDEQDTLVHF